MDDERVDLTSDWAEPAASGQEQVPFIGITFGCCGTYARVYRNWTATAYVGNCPRCAKPVRLKIGPGGSDQRFFTAY
jgi:hypothetical protein